MGRPGSVLPAFAVRINFYYRNDGRARLELRSAQRFSVRKIPLVTNGLAQFLTSGWRFDREFCSLRTYI